MEEAVFRIRMFSGILDPEFICTAPDPDPCHQQAKNEKKTWLLPFRDFFCDFLSLKNDVNVPSKGHKHKNIEKKKNFCRLQGH
jgi:hypothetical protein